MLLVFFTPNQIKISSFLNQCEHDYFAFLYILPGIAWGFSAFLIRYEYNRLLSEAWYSSFLFWTLNCIAEVLTVSLLWVDI